MATDDNTLLRHLTRPKSTLLDLKPDAVRPPAPELVDVGREEEDEEPLSPLPQPGSPYEAAHSRPANKPLPTLHLVMGDTVRGFSYANLDTIDLLPAGKPGAGPVILIRFAGLAARQVVISGRNQIIALYTHLSYHRIAWVRELPKGRDFADRGQTVITGIAVGLVEGPA